jgi:hypothetical protein
MISVAQLAEHRHALGEASGEAGVSARLLL